MPVVKPGKPKGNYIIVIEEGESITIQTSNNS